ncbi:C2H2-type zinc finger protein [Haloplanus litoreus]|uniref:C2H2-type zinc finger protein n=1 Tax=Haloplanus litoreus TaxID=767515 RepID=A0ABD5ZWI7_9EURY
MSGGATPDEDRPFACDQCDERFETREELNDHVWEYHEMDGDVTTEVTDES